MGMKRRDEISLFNAICILGVLLVHTLIGASLDFASEKGIVMLRGGFEFIFQGFIFLSGLRLYYNGYDQMERNGFYTNRGVLIFLPFLIFSVIYYFCICILSDRAIALGDFLSFFFRGDMAEDMYFMWVLIQLYAIMPVLVKILDRNYHKTTIIVAGIISFSVSALSGKYAVLERFFPQYLFFFLFGAVAGIYYKEFKTLVREKKLLISVLFGIGLMVYEIAVGLFYGVVSQAVEFIYAAFAILFLFMISTALSDRYYIKNFLIMQVDKSAYFIFLIHGLIIYITDVILNDKLAMADSFSKYGLRAAVIIAVTIGISIFWRYMTNIILLKRHS